MMAEPQKDEQMEINDEEDDEGWEEQHVFVELIGMIDPDKLDYCTKDNSSILGLDSDEQTIIKLGRYTFAGKYEHAMGNVVFFEEKEDKQLQYLCHTSKVLKASRVFLKPNNTNKESNN